MRRDRGTYTLSWKGVIIGGESLNLHSEQSFFRRSTDLTKFDGRQISDQIGDRLGADLANVRIFLWEKKPVNGSREICYKHRGKNERSGLVLSVVLGQFAYIMKRYTTSTGCYENIQRTCLDYLVGLKGGNVGWTFDKTTEYGRSCLKVLP